MKNRTAILVGSVLVLLGLFSIINEIFGINLWSLVFPLILIALGVFILYKPKSLPGNSNFILRFINESEKNRQWTVEPAEYLSFVSDLYLDFSQALIPEGETIIRFNGFVNEMDIKLPTDAGVKIKTNGFVHDTRVKGYKENHIFSPFEYETPDYAVQPKKIFIQTWSFVSEIEID